MPTIRRLSVFLCVLALSACSSVNKQFVRNVDQIALCGFQIDRAITSKGNLMDAFVLSNVDSKLLMESIKDHLLHLKGPHHPDYMDEEEVIPLLEREDEAGSLFGNRYLGHPDYPIRPVNYFGQVRRKLAAKLPAKASGGAYYSIDYMVGTSTNIFKKNNPVKVSLTPNVRLFIFDKKGELQVKNHFTNEEWERTFDDGQYEATPEQITKFYFESTLAAIDACHREVFAPEQS